MKENLPQSEGHVFISYARCDSSHCDKIKNTLDSAGIRCWLDTEEIKPGEKWLTRLEEALQNAKAMVVVCSEAAKESDYMQREFHRADELKITIIPVIIDGHDVPFHLNERNAIFLADGWQAGMERLIQALDSQASITLTQRQAELAWLLMLERKLKHLYTPLKGESRQSRRKQVSIPDEMVQHAILEHLARDVAKQLPEKKREYEDIQSAFNQVARAVLLGEPGAGKSTTLRKLASDELEKAKKDPNAPLPLLISLGQWRDAKQSFPDYLEQQLGPLGPYLQSLLQKRRGLLLLDGLNETSTDVRDDKAQALKTWLQQDENRELVCYVSCRDLDYTGAMILDLDTIRIRPLDPPRIRAFLQDYLSLPKMMGKAGKAAAEDLFGSWAVGRSCAKPGKPGKKRGRLSNISGSVKKFPVKIRMSILKRHLNMMKFGTTGSIIHAAC